MIFLPIWPPYYLIAYTLPASATHTVIPNHPEPILSRLYMGRVIFCLVLFKNADHCRYIPKALMTSPLLAQNVKKFRILDLRQCENANEIYWTKNNCGGIPTNWNTETVLVLKNGLLSTTSSVFLYISACSIAQIPWIYWPQRKIVVWPSLVETNE